MSNHRLRASARVTATGAALACAAAVLPCLAHAQEAGLPGGNAAGQAIGTNGGVLPVLGSDVRVGDLRPQLESFFQNNVSTVTRPKWIVTPAIDVQVGATDNASRYNRGGGDVFTIISPQVFVSGDTARLNVNASYNPTITEYASTPSQNQIAQYFNGNLHAIAVPDLFFIDAAGAITQQSLTSGGFNQAQGTQSYNNQDNVQTITVSINPYLERRFGSNGIGRVGYSFTRTLQDLNGGDNRLNQVDQNVLNNTANYGTTGNLSTSTVRGFYTTGENFGRYNDQLSAQATQYSGVGAYHGAYRNEVSNQVSFAIDHTVTLIGSFGYQDLHYGNGYNVNGPTYAAGFRYAPNPLTNVTIEYGRHDGDDNIAFNGQVAFTSRIRLVAQYSTGITSDLEQSQTNLGATALSSSGTLVDRSTGAPVSTSTGFSGLQNGIYRLKRFSASLLYLRERDSYTLSITNDNRTSLSNATTLIGGVLVPSGTNTTDTYASLGWQHDLLPDTSTNVTVQYGTTNSGSRYVGLATGDQTTFSVSAAITRQFTDTLSGSLRYSFYDQSGGQVLTNSGFNNGTYSANSVTVGLHKSF